MAIDLSTRRLAAHGDAFHAALVCAQVGLNDENSALLAREVGDPQVLQACVDAARAAPGDAAEGLR